MMIECAAPYCDASSQTFDLLGDHGKIFGFAPPNGWTLRSRASDADVAFLCPRHREVKL